MKTLLPPKPWLVLHIEPNVQVCDATYDAICTAAGLIKKIKAVNKIALQKNNFILDSY